MINAASKISTEYDKGKKSRKLYLKQCNLCTSDMWLPAHKWKIRTFCSRSCSDKHAETRIAVNCASCNSPIRVKPSTIKKSLHQKFFCSRKCKDFAQSLSGNCPEIRPAHYGSTLSYGRFKKEYCEGCGDRRQYLLIVHHIDSDRTNNIETNLETLCANCHVCRHLYMDNNEWKYSSRKLTPRELLSSLGA